MADLQLGQAPRLVCEPIGEYPQRPTSATGQLGAGDPDRQRQISAAAGTVRTAAHQGSTDGYGNLVKIEHADG